jgi:hypothetical protein
MKRKGTEMEERKRDQESKPADGPSIPGCSTWGFLIPLLLAFAIAPGVWDLLGGRREQVFLGEEIAQRREYSEMTAREVDEEIKAILEESYERAVSTLQEHRSELDRVADALLESEEIPGEKVLELIGVDGEESPNPSDESQA